MLSGGFNLELYATHLKADFFVRCNRDLTPNSTNDLCAIDNANIYVEEATALTTLVISRRTSSINLYGYYLKNTLNITVTEKFGTLRHSYFYASNITVVCTVCVFFVSLSIYSHTHTLSLSARMVPLVQLKSAPQFTIQSVAFDGQ